MYASNIYVFFLFYIKKHAKAQIFRAAGTIKEEIMGSTVMQERVMPAVPTLEF